MEWSRVTDPDIDHDLATMLFRAMNKHRGAFTSSPDIAPYVRSFRMPLSSRHVDFVWTGSRWVVSGGEDDWRLVMLYGDRLDDTMWCESIAGDRSIFEVDLVEIKLRYL